MLAQQMAAADSWLVRNHGARCTLVCAASVLRLLGADPAVMLPVLERATSFREGRGPSVLAYLGGHSALDRGIERAARIAGLEVCSRTRFIVRWPGIVRSLDAGLPVVLNCYRAPSRQWSHSVLAVDYRTEPRRLLTLDPNDAARRWLAWSRPATGWICTATFIEPLSEAREPAREARVSSGHSW
jgi:hypothetical protein